MVKEFGVEQNNENELMLNTQAFEFLLGGTFDPVHFGHLAIIDQLQQLNPSLLIRLVPSANPALKLEPQATFQQRMSMLELATKNYKHIVIDDCEYTLQKQSDALLSINNPKKISYTIDTLNYLRQSIPESNRVLVIGMDNLVNFEKWHQWQKYQQICHLLVINRSNTGTHNVEQQMEKCGFSLCQEFSQLLTENQGKGFFLNMPNMPQSSSEIRQSIKNSHNIDSMLPKSVIEYIQYHHLYMSKQS